MYHYALGTRADEGNTATVYHYALRTQADEGNTATVYHYALRTRTDEGKVLHETHGSGFQAPQLPARRSIQYPDYPGSPF